MYIDEIFIYCIYLKNLKKYYIYKIIKKVLNSTYNKKMYI